MWLWLSWHLAFGAVVRSYDSACDLVRIHLSLILQRLIIVGPYPHRGTFTQHIIIMKIVIIMAIIIGIFIDFKYNYLQQQKHHQQCNIIYNCSSRAFTIAYIKGLHYHSVGFCLFCLCLMTIHITAYLFEGRGNYDIILVE